MGDSITWVGMDVHKESINIAVLVDEAETPVQWQVRNEPSALRRAFARIKKLAGKGEVRACYEAGPTGFALQRQLAKLCVVCEVIAPSMIPKKAGARVKTDKIDAKNLALLLRAGLLTEVRAPDEQQEAARDLLRARENIKHDQTRCRHRITKLLLRLGKQYPHDGKHWTQRHLAWLRTLQFEQPHTQFVFDDYMMTLEQLDQRLEDFDKEIEILAASERYREAVGRLRCFRGIKSWTAMTLLTELHGFVRFLKPEQLAAYVGLVPSEHSTGGPGKHNRGAITGTGNKRVRRALVESSWHYVHRPAIGSELAARRRGQPADAIAIADKAQRRLHRRRNALLENGKHPNVANIAVARELLGFVWAALQPIAASL